MYGVDVGGWNVRRSCCDEGVDVRAGWMFMESGEPGVGVGVGEDEQSTRAGAHLLALNKRRGL
eukprot:353003-Chlamydomonas_euryale.AAC.2